MEEDTRLTVIREALQGELGAIERQLAEYGAAAEGDDIQVFVDEGFADSAQATSERGEMLSLVEQLRSSHEEVRAALIRIEDGTYGKCERCGEQIPIERLEAIPTARLCVSCKQVLGAG